MAGSSPYNPCCILVDNVACTAPRHNATTAKSKTSTGLPIAVTFCASRPPNTSHFVVNCPGNEECSAESLSPRILAEDANLVVLRVPRDSRARVHHRYSDYFVYRVDSRHPTLDLLPNPSPEAFSDTEIAILSCDGDDYVVAALQLLPYARHDFKLHLYRSINGNQGVWSCKLLSVEKTTRYKNFPNLDLADMHHPFHVSNKVIILGGDKGIVGWVDLWRGILLCNVLSLNPRLLDIPLPKPAIGNLEIYLDCCPTYLRDITVNRAKDTIKYAEMEITPPEEVFCTPPGAYPSNWLVYNECLPKYIVPGTWTTTAYRMPVGAGSVHKWEKVGTVHVGDLDPPVGNRNLAVINMLLRTSDDNKILEATKADLACLRMAYPTLSINDDVVYFVCKGTRIGSMGSLRGLVTVDVSEKILHEVDLLGVKRRIPFWRPFVASGIVNYRKTAGCRASLGHDEEEVSTANKVQKSGRHGGSITEMSLVNSILIA